MKNILLLPFFLILTVSLLGQNTALLEKEQEIDLSTDLNNLLNEEIAEAGDFNFLVKTLFNQFAIGHLSTYEKKYHLFSSEKDISITNFLVKIINTDLAEGYITNLRKNFFKDKKQVQAIYKLAIPLFIEQFKKMTPKEREAYLAFVQTGLDYVSSFNLKKETAFLEAAEKEAVGSYIEKRGELEAFIYRRISNTEISKKDCQYWLKTLQKDLLASVPSNTTLEDQYYIVRPLPLLSKHFFEARQYTAEVEVIFEKTGNDYKLVKLSDDPHDVDHLNTTAIHSFGGGLFIFPQMKDESFHLYYLQPNKTALDFGPQNARLKLNRIYEFKDKNAWRLFPKKVYALNKEGILENNSFPENIKNSPAYLFKFKSGETKFLYDRRYKDLASIKTVVKELRYAKNGSEILILDEEDSLHLAYNSNYYWIASTKLEGPVQNIDFSCPRGIIIEYESGKLELLVLLWDEKKFARIPITEKLDLSFIQFTGTSAKDKDLFIFTLKNKQKGLLNSDGETLLQPIYSELSPFENIISSQKEMQFLFASNSNKLLGLIDENGQVIIAPNYSAIRNFYSVGDRRQLPYIRLTDKEGKMGLADSSGKVILNPNFKRLSLLVKEIAIQETNPESGKVKNHFFCTPPDNFWKTALDYSNFQKFIEKRNKEGLFFLDNSNSQLFSAPKASFLKKIGTHNKLFLGSNHVRNPDPRINIFQENLVAKKDLAFNLIDINGKVLYPNIENLFLFSSVIPEVAYCGQHQNQEIPLYFVGKRNAEGVVKIALFTKEFDQITDFLFDWMFLHYKVMVFDPETFEENYSNESYSGAFRLVLPTTAMILKQGNKETVYDFSGKMLISPNWDSIAPFEQDSDNFLVQKDKNFGIVNRFDKTILAANFAHIYKLDRIPLFFVGKVMPDKSIRYALYSSEGKALTEHDFRPSRGEKLIYDFTGDDYMKEVDLLPGENADFDKKEILLLIEDKEVRYSFEGKRLD